MSMLPGAYLVDFGAVERACEAFVYLPPTAESTYGSLVGHAGAVHMRLQSKIAQLRRQIQELEARAADAEDDHAEALRRRIAELEARVAALEAALHRLDHATRLFRERHSEIGAIAQKCAHYRTAVTLALSDARDVRRAAESIPI